MTTNAQLQAAKWFRFAAMMFGLLGTLPAQADDLGKFLEETWGAIEKERQGKWKQVNWHNDPAKALAAAEKEQKPLLIFLHVRGQFNFDPRPEAC